MATRSPRKSQLKIRVLSTAIATCFAAGSAWSLPVAPTVVSGTATFNQAGNVLSVTNSNNAIINWQKFGISAGEVTKFIQSSASSSVLNRVVGGELSAIYGSLQSNGRVWLVNPAGILVGPGGSVNTAAFLASTLGVRNEDFLAGKLTFSGAGGNVVNQGTITTPTGGSVYLIGANVTNEGVITTPKGEVILAAGQTVNLVDTATPGVKVEITGAEGNTTNLGEIAAEAGRIGMAGVIVRNSGTLNASSAVEEGGRVFLKASQDTYVDGSGRIVTTGTKGGRVEVLGNRVAVMDSASIDASGTNGGGTVLVGGDFQGKNPEVQNSQITFFGPNASIKANAQNVGDGGKVIVWADDTTRAYGNIQARGGENGGNGGFVETSGKQHLDVGSMIVDTSAVAGNSGTWLLDPADIDITPSGIDVFSCSPSPTCFSSYTGGSVFEGTSNTTNQISWTTLTNNLALGSVIVSTASSMTAAGNVNIYGGTFTTYSSPNDLWFVAHNNISVNGATLQNTGGGALRFIAGWDGTFPASRFDYTAYNVNTSGSVGYLSVAGSIIQTTGDIFLKAGANIAITPTSGANTWVYAGGGLHVDTWGSLMIGFQASESFNGTTNVMSVGDQAIKFHNTFGGLAIKASSTAGFGGEARLASQYGSQVIDFTAAGPHSITLQGGSGLYTPSGARASMQAAGHQSILNSGMGTLDISLTGGNVSATGLDAYHDYGLPTQTLVCTGCATNNSAEIYAGGNQTIRASSINLAGGSGGNGNDAGIWARGNSDVAVTGALNITGGSSGGQFVLRPDGVWDSVSNDAGIDADGFMTLSAGNIILTGGSATAGGAYIGGVAGLSLTSTGNVSLYGGTTYNSDPYNPATPVFIGSEWGNVALNISGSLNMSGGTTGSSQGSPAFIGTMAYGPTTTISVGSSILLSSNANAAPVAIGTYNPYGDAYYGWYGLTGDIGIGPSASISANGSISLSAWGSIGIGGLLSTPGTVTLDAGYLNPGSYMGIGIAGLVSAGTVNATSSYAISASSMYGDPYSYYYYMLPAISANSINLTTQYGGYINATTASSGTISATINGSPGWSSSIFIQNYGNPTTVRLIDNNPTSSSYVDSYTGLTHPSSWIGFYNMGDLTLGSGSQFSSASGANIGIGSTGTLSLTGLSLQSSGYIELLGDTGIKLSGVTAHTSAIGRVFDGSTYIDPFTGTTTGYLHLIANGIGLYSGGDITLSQGTRIEAPNADVLIELGSSNSNLYVGEAIDTSRSYVLSKSTSTYVDFLGRGSGGIYIQGVPTTTTEVGGSGFFAGDLMTPAIEGTNLIITYAGATLDVCTISPDLCRAPLPPDYKIDSLVIPVVSSSALGQALVDDTGGGEGEFGEGEDGGKGKGQGKKPVRQCKG